MELRNNFNHETRGLFFYNRKCFWCEQQHGWDALHHILGRVSSSPLNACPINNNLCHISNGCLDSFENKSILLKKTFAYLIKNEYQLTTEDKQFVKDNKQYYLWKNTTSE